MWYCRSSPPETISRIFCATLGWSRLDNAADGCAQSSTTESKWYSCAAAIGNWTYSLPHTHTHTMHAHHSQHVTVGWLVGVEFLMPHSTQYRSFWRRSSQPSLDWYWQTKQYRKIPIKNSIQIRKSKQPKIQQTKLPWFSCLLQHSARKRGGLILQCSRSPHGAQHITVTGPPHMHTCKTVVSYSVTDDQLRTIYATTESTFI